MTEKKRQNNENWGLDPSKTGNFRGKIPTPSLWREK